MRLQARERLEDSPGSTERISLLLAESQVGISQQAPGSAANATGGTRRGCPSARGLRGFAPLTEKNTTSLVSFLRRSVFYVL